MVPLPTTTIFLKIFPLKQGGTNKCRDAQPG